MNHLSPAEFVDAADRRLPPTRIVHLERCERCRTRLADVQRVLESANAADVPEPSPLYWQHFRANVSARIADESIVPGWRAVSWRDFFNVRSLVPVASALALVAAVFVAGNLGPRPTPLPPAPPFLIASAPPDAVIPENSEVWQVLTSAASEMSMDDTHEAGMGVPGSAIDGAVQRMTPAELAELGRLLQSQLRGSGD